MRFRDRVRNVRFVWLGDMCPAADATYAELPAGSYLGSGVIGRELPDGSLELIDGHLRPGTGLDAIVPVLTLSLNEQLPVGMLDPIRLWFELGSDATRRLSEASLSHACLLLLNGRLLESGLVNDLPMTQAEFNELIGIFNEWLLPQLGN